MHVLRPLVTFLTILPADHASNLFQPHPFIYSTSQVPSARVLSHPPLLLYLSSSLDASNGSPNVTVRAGHIYSL